MNDGRFYAAGMRVSSHSTLCLPIYFCFFISSPLHSISPSQSTSWVLLSNCDVDGGHDGGLSSAAWGAVWQDSHPGRVPSRYLAECPFCCHSQVCLHACVILHYRICACFSISCAPLRNFLRLLSNLSICPTRPCPPPPHLPGLQFAQLQKWRCAFSISNTPPALLDFSTPLLCCIIIMSGRER